MNITSYLLATETLASLRSHSAREIAALFLLFEDEAMCKDGENVCILSNKRLER